MLCHRDLLQARVLIIECTIIDSELTPTETAERGHIHLEHLNQAALQKHFRNEHIVLTHFSARYAQEYVIRRVQSSMLLSACRSAGIQVHLLFSDIDEESHIPNYSFSPNSTALSCIL